MRGGAAVAGGPVIGQHMYTPAAAAGSDRMSTPMRHQPITAGVVGGYTAAAGGGGRHDDSYTRQHSRYNTYILRLIFLLLHSIIT